MKDVGTAGLAWMFEIAHIVQQDERDLTNLAMLEEGGFARRGRWIDAASQFVLTLVDAA